MSSKDFYNLENCEITINGHKINGFVGDKPMIECKKAEDIKDLDIPMMPADRLSLLCSSLEDLKKRNKGLYLWIKQRLPKNLIKKIDKIYVDTLNPLSITIKLKESIKSIVVIGCNLVLMI